MPIYEYQCGACGHRFEEWQKITEAPVKTCPKCKAKKVERLISATSFTLKGGGWYSDLYSSSKSGSGGGSSSESSSSSSASDSSSKSESKGKSTKKKAKSGD
jgi:putative FmdB family regulatory protein